jgi:hemolysin-activating ACP:hemolysin acyltransferase
VTSPQQSLNNYAADAASLNRVAAVSKLISASIGDIAVVFSKSPAHKHYSLADIEWMILPAVVSSQAYIAEMQHNETGARAPVAAVTWAYVSVDIDQQLRSAFGQRVKLDPRSWKSGEIAWLIDMAGEPRALAASLDHLNRTAFKDRAVNLWTRGPTGEKRVLTLSEALQAMSTRSAGVRT